MRSTRARNRPRKGSPKGDESMVHVLDKHKRPLMPCTEKRARLLLERGRAVVHKMAPFTIRLKDRLVLEQRAPAHRTETGPRIQGHRRNRRLGRRGNHLAASVRFSTGSDSDGTRPSSASISPVPCTRFLVTLPGVRSRTRDRSRLLVPRISPFSPTVTPRGFELCRFLVLFMSEMGMTPVMDGVMICVTEQKTVFSRFSPQNGNVPRDVLPRYGVRV